MNFSGLILDDKKDWPLSPKPKMVDQMVCFSRTSPKIGAMHPKAPFKLTLLLLLPEQFAPSSGSVDKI